MNIFAVDPDPHVAAKMLCNKHVVKMVLESAQMLSTINRGAYKRTHVNHPCTQWARRTRENYQWLADHAVALGAEYQHRYGKTHKSMRVIMDCYAPTRYNGFYMEGLTPFEQCMIEDFKQADSVMAYQAYYNHKTMHMDARWSKRERPDFITWRKDEKGNILTAVA